MIAVAEDAQGLRQAYLEMLEESLDAPERERNERFAEMAANREALLRELPNKRTLSPGYYRWIGYIQESIEMPLECGVTILESELDADELVGLAALRSARSEFRRLHPPCAGCGRSLPSADDRKCPECQRAEFENKFRNS